MHWLDAGLGDEHQFTGLHAGPTVQRDDVGLDHDHHAVTKWLIRDPAGRPAVRAGTGGI